MTRASDGLELGLTPLGIDVPYADVPQEFLLRKAGFEDKTVAVVPNLPVPLFVTMQAKPATTDEGGGLAGLTANAAHGKHKPVILHRPASRPSSKSDSDQRAMPLDRDAVLEPDFK